MYGRYISTALQLVKFMHVDLQLLITKDVNAELFQFQNLRK